MGSTSIPRCQPMLCRSTGSPHDRIVDVSVATSLIDAISAVRRELSPYVTAFDPFKMLGGRRWILGCIRAVQ